MNMNCFATVVEVKKKSRSKGIKDAKVGDIIEFSCPLERAGHNGGGTYATYIFTKNIRTRNEWSYTFNELRIVFDSLELEETTIQDALNLGGI